MELLIAGMYLAGLGVVIWWMTRISRFADWAVDKLFPPKEEATRAHGGAARAAREINHWNCNTKKEERQDGKAVRGRYQSRVIG